MINPHRKLQWRPTSDFAHRYEISPSCELYMPASRDDALTYVAELALRTVVDYDGYPDLQSEIIQEEAARMFPSLFEVKCDASEARSVELKID